MVLYHGFGSARPVSFTLGSIMIGRIATQLFIAVLLAGCAASSSRNASDNYRAGEVSQEAIDGFPYTQYQPSTIMALAQEAQRLKKDSHPDGKLIIPVERYRLRFTYAGEVRPLSKESHEFLNFIARVFPHIPSEQWATYTHEIHVSQGGIDMWQPIQGEILSTLIPSLSHAKEFDAYAFWVGENNGQQMCLINSARTHEK